MKKLFVLFVIFITVFFAGCSGNFEFEENSNLEGGLSDSKDVDVSVETEDTELNIEGNYEFEDVEINFDDYRDIIVEEVFNEFYYEECELNFENDKFETVDSCGAAMKCMANKFSELIPEEDLESLSLDMRSSGGESAMIKYNSINLDVENRFYENVESCITENSKDPQEKEKPFISCNVVALNKDYDSVVKYVYYSDEVSSKSDCINQYKEDVFDRYNNQFDCEREDILKFAAEYRESDDRDLMIVEYDYCNEEVDEVQYCVLGAGLEDFDVTVEDKFKVSSRAECDEAFDKEILEGNLYACSSEIGYREAEYIKVAESTSYERVVYDKCEEYIPEEEGNDEVVLGPDSATISLGDYEATTVQLGNAYYNISVGKMEQLNGLITINGVSRDIQVYSGEYIGNVYVYINDMVYSSRDAVKSYVQLIVSLQEVEGEFFCTDTGSDILGYLDGVTSSLSDYCFDDSTRVDYYCADDEKTINMISQTCEFGCSNGACNICTVSDEDKLPNYFSVGEGSDEVIIVGNHTYTFTAESVSDSKVLLTYNFGNTKSYDSCEFFEEGGVRFQVNDLVSSSRPGVAGYVEIGYELIQ